MTRTEWLALMRFPTEWETFGMLPPEYTGLVVPQYEPGHEDASEHDRHGAFQWWLKQDPSEEILVKLAMLSWLDPDPLMGGYVRDCIAKSAHCSAEVLRALRSSPR